MKCSKGGLTFDALLELDVDDFVEACEAARELELAIAKAMKG